MREVGQLSFWLGFLPPPSARASRQQGSSPEHSEICLKKLKKATKVGFTYPLFFESMGQEFQLFSATLRSATFSPKRVQSFSLTL